MGGQGAVPIKHYPTINWNFGISSIGTVTLKFQLNTIQRLTETLHGGIERHRLEAVPIKHYPTINWNLNNMKWWTSSILFQLNTIQRLTETLKAHLLQGLSEASSN